MQLAESESVVNGFHDLIAGLNVDTSLLGSNEIGLVPFLLSDISSSVDPSV